MIQETKQFKKRFHLVGISQKIEITSLLAVVVTDKKMPGGRLLTEQELYLLKELLEWCNINIFFDVTPKDAIPKNY